MHGRALNGAGALLALFKYADIKVVYCYYMLISYVECSWYVKF